LTSVSIYAAINAVPRLTGAVLALVYASVFSLPQYGEFGVLSVIIGLLGIVLDLGVPQAILRNYYDFHQDWPRAQSYLATVLLGASVTALAVLPVLAVGLYLGWHWLHIGHRFVPEYVALVLSIAFFERSSTMFGMIFRALERPISYAAGSLAQGLVTVSVSVILVFFAHMRVAGALLALLAGRMAAAGLYQMILRFRVGVHGGRIEWAEIRSCLSFGLPLVPTRLAAWGREAGLRPTLVNVVSVASVGVFSFASSIAAFPLLASSAVEFVLSPYYFKQRVAGGEGFVDRVEKFGVIFLALVTPVWATGILFSPELLKVFAHGRFEIAVPICAVLLCASFVRTQQPYLGRQINFLRKTWLLPTLTVPCAALSIALAVVFARAYGITSAGWAVLIADVTLYLASTLAIRVYERVHHPLTPTLGMTAALALLAVWIIWLPHPVGLSQVPIKLLVLGVIFSACLAKWIWPNRDFIRAIARG